MKLTGNLSQCPTCKEVFSTERNFNKHRRGEYGVNRHCANPADVGLHQDHRGVWKLPKSDSFPHT